MRPCGESPTSDRVGTASDWRPRPQASVFVVSSQCSNGEAVIEAPFPREKISETQIKLFGRPYFFNVKSPADLSFSWTATDQSPANSNEPENLVINLGENVQNDTPLSVNLNIQNPVNIFEAAGKTINLVFSL